MREYLITEAFLNELKAVLGEVPGKLSAQPLLKLHQLRPLEAEAKAEAAEEVKA